LGDEGGALQAKAGCGSTDSAYAAAGFAEGVFDLFACEGRHDGAHSLWANGSGSNFRGRRNHGGCRFKFGGEMRSTPREERMTARSMTFCSSGRCRASRSS